MVFLHLELKGLFPPGCQVVALIDTLTNYVLSVDERVPTQKDILYGSNGNDAMSLCYESAKISSRSCLSYCCSKPFLYISFGYMPATRTIQSL